MIKKHSISDNIIILELLIISIVSIYVYFVYPRVEKHLVKNEISSIVDKINNKEVVSIKKYNVKNNKAIYDSVINYLNDVKEDTNFFNNLSINKDGDFIKIFELESKDLTSKREYINNIKNELDNRINHLNSINKDDYFKELDDSSKKLVNNYYLNKNINLNAYEDKYNEVNSNVLYINKIFDYLDNNSSNYEVTEGKVIIGKRSVYNSFKEVVEDREEILVKPLEYELVNDVTPPVIEASDITIYTGNTVNPSGIAKCTDDVDDAVECIISENVDINKAGTYPVTITAKDQSGNEASKTINIIVKNRVMYATGTNPYYIEVIRNQNVVVVYGKDSNNNYSNIVKVFVVSVGRSGMVTPTGTFSTTKGQRWGALYGGVYGQYSTRIVGSILFHSVPYYSASPDNLEWEEYNKLGTAASMGCVRMRVIDAKWIYDNCPSGTTVRIYDGSLPSGVSKPYAYKIPSDSPYRGWDPTDPDSNNPW